MKKKFSIIIPIYGNEKNIPITIPYIVDHLYLLEKYDVEIIMVNDGSPDASWEVMKEYQQKYPELIRIAKLSRNFGQGCAQRCGMDMAKGDVIGVITADMQDPFELFVDLLREWENGYKFVLGERKAREEKGLIARCSTLYNKLTQRYVNKRYPSGGFDLYVIDRSVAEALKNMNQNYPLAQNYLLWLGYEYKAIEYVRKKRETGKSGYGFFKKLKVALKIFLTRTELLFNSIMTLGVCMVLFGVIAGIVDIVLTLTGVFDFNIIFDAFCLLCLFFGSTNMFLSLIGKSIFYNMEYTKNDPCYIVDEIIESNQ